MVFRLVFGDIPSECSTCDEGESARATEWIGESDPRWVLPVPRLLLQPVSGGSPDIQHAGFEHWQSGLQGGCVVGEARRLRKACGVCHSERNRGISARLTPSTNPRHSPFTSLVPLS